MKKFLALVLALVMTMSLVTISAGAEDYTDDSSIAYGEAVDVVSALGIVGGYADGSFNPTAGLSRGAASKIICNMILGPTTAGALSADTAPYTDVAVDNTYAGYIAYCAQQGIISGYADGTFRPYAPLTGYAFMKMLLGALGYDAELESYTGANWSVAVAKQAIAIGLNDGNEGFVGTKAVTREEAALYTFNTLKANVVEYADKGTNITIGGTTINTGASKAESVDASNNGYGNQLLDGADRLQFAEKYFKKLVRTVPTTDFGEPTNTWHFKGEKIGTYVETPDLTYTEAVKGKNVWADLGLSGASADYLTHKVDGVTAGGVSVSKTEDNEFGSQGALTSVYLTVDDDDAETHVTVITKNVYLGKIVSIDEATATTKRTANIAPQGVAASALTGATSFETEDFARKDYVCYTAASTNGGSTYAVKSLAKADTISGTFAAYASNTSITVDGTVYKMGSKAATTGATYGGSLKDVVDLYLDNNGNVLEIKTSEAADASYAYVLDENNTAGGAFAPHKAELLFLDGTTKVVETDANYNTLKNGFVTFTVNSDDKYVLADADSDVGATGMKITNGASAMTIDGATFYANDATIFVVATTGTGGAIYTVYTGIKNVPTLDNGSDSAVAVQSAVVCKAGSVANYVYVDATSSVTISGGTNNVIFVLGKKNADKNVNVDNNGYYVLDAVVNGEITTLNVDDGVTGIGALVNGAPASAIYSTSSTDKYGITTLASATGSSSVGIDEVSKGVVTFFVDGAEGSDVIRPVASDINVYYVNNAGKIVVWDIDSIAYDLNDVVYYTIDDGAVDNIFIVSK